MKKLFLFAVAACLALCSINASAQDDPHFGVEGGLNVSYINGMSAANLPEEYHKYGISFATAPFAGGHLGFFGEWEFTEVVGIRPSLHIGQQGTLFALGDNSSTKYKGFSAWACETALNIPVHFTFDVMEDRIKILIGPQFGFALACKNYIWWTNDDGKHIQNDFIALSNNEYSVFDIGLSVGGLFMFTDYIGMNVKFNCGFIDFIKTSAAYNCQLVGQVGIVVRIS